MILLIRHGQPTHHTEHLTGGWTDSTLTALGRQQMLGVGEGLKIDFATRPKPLLYTSDLRRAVQSAELIAQVLGVQEVKQFHFLREKNNGKAANLTEQEAKKFFRRPPTETALDHANYEGGETRREFFHRVATGMNKLALGERDIIIVAHKGTIQNIVFWWLGFDIAEIADKKFSLSNSIPICLSSSIKFIFMFILSSTTMNF
mgnify:CR=1 FL=1